MFGNFKGMMMQTQWAFKPQIVVASGICLLLALLLLAFPKPMEGMWLAAIGLVFLPLVVYKPFLVCMAFVIFSFFRLHEAFPVLFGFHIPEILGALMLTLLVIFLLLGRVRPYWSPQLSVLLLLFALVTFGILFATNRSAALVDWQGTYIKIIVSVLAIAWLLRSDNDLRWAMGSIVLAGMLVGLVALYNKINGIDLVEGTRVTIGLALGSLLGDPNDLSLVLLLPVSFAAALLLTPGLGGLWRGLGLVTVTVMILAIVATQSRGGLLGLAAVMAVFTWYRFHSKALLVVILVIGIVGLFTVAHVEQRVSGGAAEKGIDESSQGRLNAWTAATNMAMARPLTGVGLANFPLNYYLYTSAWGGRAMAVHSAWFQALAETGFLGFSVFITLVGMTWRRSYRCVTQLVAIPTPRTATQTMLLASAKGIFASLIGFCVAGSFLTQAFNWPFYIILGLSIAVSWLSAQQSAATV